MTDIEIPRGSLEYITPTVRCNFDLDMTVQIAIGRESPDVYTWLDAEWVGESVAVILRGNIPGFSRGCQTVEPVAIDETYAGSQTVYVKLTDNPEAPIIPADKLKVI